MRANRRRLAPLDDPKERRTVAGEHPDRCTGLRTSTREGWDPGAIAAELARRNREQEVDGAWGANSGVEEPDPWPVPESAWVPPTR